MGHQLEPLLSLEDGIRSGFLRELHSQGRKGTYLFLAPRDAAHRQGDGHGFWRRAANLQYTGDRLGGDVALNRVEGSRDGQTEHIVAGKPRFGAVVSVDGV